MLFLAAAGKRLQLGLDDRVLMLLLVLIRQAFVLSALPDGTGVRVVNEVQHALTVFVARYFIGFLSFHDVV